MQLDKTFDDVCARFDAIQKKYAEVKDAFSSFVERKRELSSILFKRDEEDESDSGVLNEYPDEETKDEIRKNVSEKTNAQLAGLIKHMKPDLGSLNDEMQMVFIANEIMQEVARRLEGVTI